MKRSGKCESLEVKENTILSGNCKCLDQRAMEESGEKVEKNKTKQKNLVAKRAFILGGSGEPLKDHRVDNHGQIYTLERSITLAETDRRPVWSRERVG